MTRRVSERLYLADVCKLAAKEQDGWVAANGKPAEKHLKRMLRWIRKQEARTARRVLHGGGKPGQRFWTTKRELAALGIFTDPDLTDEMETLREEMEQLRADLRTLGGLVAENRVLIEANRK